MPPSMWCWSGSSRCLRKAACWWTTTDLGTEPRLLVYLEHAIRDGRVVKSGEPRAVSQRLQFIHLKEDGSASDAGPAPYLDCRPARPRRRLPSRMLYPRPGSPVTSRSARSAMRSRGSCPSISPR